MRALLVLALITVAPAAFASAPAGVWAVPAGVTVIGAESDTPTVIIIGRFTVHTGQGSEGSQWGFAGFEPTVEGYMQYICKAGDKDMCLLQWDDISKAAQDKACVGWGGNDGSNGVVHATGSANETPDEWDLAMGVVSGFMPCEYLASYDPSGGDAESDGGADVADPDPDDVPPVTDVVEDSADVPPEVDGGPIDDSTDDSVDDSIDDSIDPQDVVSTDIAVSDDTLSTDVAGNDAAAGADTAAPAKTADDDGCAGGPMSVLGLVVGMGWLVRRRFAFRGARG